jgi:hypothetical protein
LAEASEMKMRLTRFISLAFSLDSVNFENGPGSLFH